MKKSGKYLYSVVIPNFNEAQLAIRLRRIRKGVLALVLTHAEIELDETYFNIAKERLNDLILEDCE